MMQLLLLFLTQISTQLCVFIKEINALPEPRPLETRVPLWSHWATLATLIALLGIFWTGRKLNGAF